MVMPEAAEALVKVNLDNDTILVVGGDGFLGSHIVELLLSVRAAKRAVAHAAAQVPIAGRDYSSSTSSTPDVVRLPSPTPVHVLDLQQRWPSQPSVIYHIGSILDHQFLVDTLRGNHITCVIHAASPPHGRPASFYQSVNVEGTRTLIQACIEAGVTKLVYTSSASVVFNGEDLYNATEDLLYCKVPLDAYTETKAAAEDLVLKANNLPTNSGSPLLTCALRPSGIFGPRDGQALPGFLSAVAEGKSHLVLGNGKNLCDFTYVENAAAAHLLAAAKLVKGTGVAGEAFNVTNDEPIPFWDFNKRLMALVLPPGDPRIRRAASVHIPRFLALALAYVTGFFAVVVGKLLRRGDDEPLLLFTPFRVRIATATRTFSIAKAKARLEYRPLFSLDQGIARSAAWIRTEERWRPLWDTSSKDELEQDMKLKEE